MKPKTKRQKLVYNLSNKLPPITLDQSNWAKENCFKLKGYLRKKTIWCLECGQNFESGTELAAQICGIECPHCGKGLNVTRCAKRSFNEKWYYTIFTTSKEFQVLRHFMAEKTCKVGYQAELTVRECVQNWISPDGSITNIARTTGISMYYDLWNYNSPMEIRAKLVHNYKYNLYSEFIYPKKRIIPELKRNGFKGGLHNITPSRLLSGLLSNPKLETLIKAKQYSLLKSFTGKYLNIDKYWNSIKVCIRNKYIVRDASTWCDYIDQLIRLEKDINNAHYVCPKDLEKAHDLYIAKSRRAYEMQESKKKIERAHENEKAYKQFIGCFSDLLISDDEIRVEPLKSVAEFIEEGDTMHHCVFANDYFSKKDALILSAKINDQRIETIEFDLKEMRVVQSKAIFNDKSKFHDRIINLVDSNKDLIRKCKHRESNIELSSKAI